MIDTEALLARRAADRAAASALHRGRHDSPGVLLYVAAQHPLVARFPGGERAHPGSEFQARLRRSVDLARTFSGTGSGVRLLVCGDLHRDRDGRTDAMSLREAGLAYLRDCGIEEGQFVPAHYLPRYRPDGVYCTEDEVAVAAGVFRDDDRLGTLVGVCGQAQALRVLLAAENERVPMQVETPLVWDAADFSAGQLADPVSFWHEPGVEALRTAPVTCLMPLDSAPFAALRDAAKRARAAG